MPTDPHAGLSARERELLHIVYRRGETTAAEIRDDMEEPPTDATVRSLLRVLEEKGWLEHRREDGRFVYTATRPREEMRRGMLAHMVETFFDGSSAGVVAALVDASGTRLRPGEEERLRRILEALEARETDS